jgi:nucleoside-diphosphate-sugar epimerase
MKERILMTGAGGFIGYQVARRLLETRPGSRIVLTDRASHPRVESLTGQTEFIEADLTDPEACRRVVTPDIATVFHFAGIVSGGAEQDFELGMKVNLHATMHMLEACRAAGRGPRFVFTSTIASFGGSDLPEVVDDWTFQHPQCSYGVAKVACEQLLNDYSRRGFVDGRGVRLAATVVRDDPHAGLSCCTSALIREPVAGHDYVCPLPPEVRMPILSARRTADMLIFLSEVGGERLGDYRTINGPNICPTMQEIADTVRKCGAESLGTIAFDPDPAAVAVVASWPKGMKFDRAAALGLTADESLAAIVQGYLE